MFDRFEGTGSGYKTQYRCIITNLRDKKNPELKQAVLNGGLTPEKFAGMTDLVLNSRFLYIYYRF